VRALQKERLEDALKEFGLAMVKVKKGRVEEAMTALQNLLSGSASRLVKKRAQEQIEELRDK
jgi:hypothetical protein